MTKLEFLAFFGLLQLVAVVHSFSPMISTSRQLTNNFQLFAEKRKKRKTGYNKRSDTKKRGRGSGPNSRGGRGNNQRSEQKNEPQQTNSYDFDDDPFGDYDDDFHSDDGFDEEYDEDEFLNSAPKPKAKKESQSHFFSKKSLSDPKFSIESETFQDICNGAGIDKPSKIQALAWPTLLQGKSAIVADQTGSGKTLSYVLPLLQRMLQKSGTSKANREYGSPKILILAPTAELADQIKIVCDKTISNLSVPVTTRVITATGAYSSNIRDQIRMLDQTPIDILISTPGRVATILRTKNTSLNLSNLQAIVLDEVDVLLIDDTFGPQLRTIGAAAPVAQTQFVFVTATLPDEIIESVQKEFRDVEVLQGPGLHRVAPSLKEHLVDVSVPPTENKNLDLCFEYKAKEVMKALRSNRCKRSLVFCNTVETCRRVENLIKRNDRRGRMFNIGAYHNAMTPDSRRKNLEVFAKGLDRKTKGGQTEVVDHVLVCTDRAARGVDFDSAPVDHVIIFDFPKDPAEYIRRVGRTGRAGREGVSTVFAFAWQLPIARKIMGSKLESYSVAADNFEKDEDAEYSQKQRREKRSRREQEKLIKTNIQQGKSWK